MTRPIYQVDRAMAEAAIKRSYEQGREHEREDTKGLVEELAQAFKGSQRGATAEDFAKAVLYFLMRGLHEKKHEGECLGSPRQ